MKRQALKLTSPQVELLKWTAIATMVVDHFHKINLHEMGGAAISLSVIGRIAFPLFAFLIAHNYAHFSKGFSRYGGRMLVFAALSQPAFMYAFPDRPYVNIIFTLFLGLFLLHSMVEWEKTPSRQTGGGLTIALVATLVGGFVCDYGHAGLIMIPAFYLWLTRRDVFTFTLMGYLILAANSFDLNYVFGLFSLPLITLTAQKTFKFPRTPGLFFYLFYPAHLVVLAWLVN